jgi:tRNA(Ile)-lysidine synthase
VLTGHTADDQAETVLLRLLRGSGADGLGAMTPGETHPILALRRSETRALCDELGHRTVDDPMNVDPTHQRVRIRHEVLPLLAAVAGRDVVPLLTRTADLLRDDGALLTDLAGALDPTDARAIAAAHPTLARRAVRTWLTVDGYPPDLATVDRVLAVARGEHVACEIGGGRQVRRSGQRLCVSTAGR